MLTEIMDGLIKILGPIATISKDRRDFKGNSLRVISNALDETYLYYKFLDRNERDYDKKAQLVKYWSAAAISIRHFDVDLAAKCDVKAEVLIDFEFYSNTEIRNLDVGLDNLRSAYRKLLK